VRPVRHDQKRLTSPKQTAKPPQEYDLPQRGPTAARPCFGLLGISTSLEIAISRSTRRAATPTMYLASSIGLEGGLLTRRPTPRLRAAAPTRPVGAKAPIFR